MAKETIEKVRAAEENAEKMLAESREKADNIIKDANTKARQIENQSSAAVGKKREEIIAQSKQYSLNALNKARQDAKNETKLLAELAKQKEKDAIKGIISLVIG
ncbi:MAG: hypothetical protein PUG48_10300 [Clostridia bacterium]|nr:hypothetical protein [Clostridia bacterium]